MLRAFKVAPAPARARSYAVAEQHVAEAEELWRRSSEGSSRGGGGGEGASAPPLPRAHQEPLTFAKSAKTIVQRTTVTRQARDQAIRPQGSAHICTYMTCMCMHVQVHMCMCMCMCMCKCACACAPVSVGAAIESLVAVGVRDVDCPTLVGTRLGLG